MRGMKLDLIKSESMKDRSLSYLCFNCQLFIIRLGGESSEEGDKTKKNKKLIELVKKQERSGEEANKNRLWRAWHGWGFHEECLFYHKL